MQGKIIDCIFIWPPIARFGPITDLDQKDFQMEGGQRFYIKNTNDEPIDLFVIPGSPYIENPEFVKTRFYPGWNNEVVLAVKKTDDEITGLLFGC